MILYVSVLTIDDAAVGWTWVEFDVVSVETVWGIASSSIFQSDLFQSLIVQARPFGFWNICVNEICHH